MTTPAKARNHNIIVKRALKALEENIAPQEFADKVKGMEKEEFDTLLDELPEEMKTNPKSFFKLVKAVGGISKAGVLVNEITTEDGTAVTAEVGGT